MMDNFFEIISEFETDTNDNMLENMPLANAYVPMQKWRDIYDYDVGNARGTIFFELDLPFLGRKAIE